MTSHAATGRRSSGSEMPRSRRVQPDRGVRLAFGMADYRRLKGKAPHTHRDLLGEVAKPMPGWKWSAGNATARGALSIRRVGLTAPPRSREPGKIKDLKAVY
jgi:hypothetical protein